MIELQDDDEPALKRQAIRGTTYEASSLSTGGDIELELLEPVTNEALGTLQHELDPVDQLIAEEIAGIDNPNNRRQDPGVADTYTELRRPEPQAVQ